VQPEYIVGLPLPPQALIHDKLLPLLSLTCIPCPFEVITIWPSQLRAAGAWRALIRECPPVPTYPALKFSLNAQFLSAQRSPWHAGTFLRPICHRGKYSWRQPFYVLLHSFHGRVTSLLHKWHRCTLEQRKWNR